MDSIIDEISLRLGDIEYREISKEIYKRALFRANRILAKKYDIYQKVVSFNLNNKVSDLTSDILLEIDDFIEEILLDINGICTYTKVNDIKNNGEYYLKYIGNQLIFNYSSNNKSLDDEITLLYKAIPIEDDISEYVLPNKYFEEQIRESILYLSEIGMSRFISSEEKFNKYKLMNQIYSKQNEADKLIVKNTNWATIKPHWSL